jgi:pentose-5-phosphate-3-epimerase
MSLVVPAVLPSSERDLEEKLALFASLPQVNRVQIDVVDGKFAAPASWPYTAPQALEDKIKRGEMLPATERISYEVDLMCLHAEQAVEAWLTLGATRLTFHAESLRNVSQGIASVREQYGSFIALGLALSVESDLALLEQSLAQIDYVQFMGIARIGRQGQPFDKRVLKKVRLFHKRHPAIPLQVDGGVSLAHAPELVALGVSHLIVGSGIVRATDPAATLRAFEALESPFGV